MSLFITSLNSGSNGNCYYVGNKHEAVLVDAGISCRETEKRMLRLGLSINKVKAIFISHEHTDHISGVPVLAKKYNIPVYVTPGTLKHLRINPDEYQIVHFIAHHSITIGDLVITAFPKFHDAVEPHSFIIACGDITVGVFTDIGIACEHLITHFSKCHAVFLEANYDDEMLDSGGYPYYLKRRIRGGNGHLSNKQALELFIKHKPEFMSHVLLAHLSKNNNSPELVYELFNANAKRTKVIVASRYVETPVFQIGESNVIGRAKQLTFEL
ncbi:MBL fold metallo-hydrolase [Mucilaginibacter sp.]